VRVTCRRRNTVDLSSSVGSFNAYMWQNIGNLTPPGFHPRILRAAALKPSRAIPGGSQVNRSFVSSKASRQLCPARIEVRTKFRIGSISTLLRCVELLRSTPKPEIRSASQHFGVGRVEDGRGSLGHSATLRFPSPLIEPDVRCYRIRLSDWFHREAHDGAFNGRRSRRRSPRSP